MARDKNTFVKRQRETGKKQKAEEKRARRQKRKEIAANGQERAREIRAHTQVLHEHGSPAGSARRP